MEHIHNASLSGKRAWHLGKQIVCLSRCCSSTYARQNSGPKSEYFWRVSQILKLSFPANSTSTWQASAFLPDRMCKSLANIKGMTTYRNVYFGCYEIRLFQTALESSQVRWLFFRWRGLSEQTCLCRRQDWICPSNSRAGGHQSSTHRKRSQKQF